MRDELDVLISSYFEVQVASVPPRPFPSSLLENTDSEEAQAATRRRKAGRRPAVLTLAFPLKLVGAAAIAATCIFFAPRRTAGPVARGVEALVENTEFRATLCSTAVEIVFETGKAISKE